MNQEQKIGFIYCITNNNNGKKLIGSTSRTILKRMGEHMNLLRKSKHPNSHFQSTWTEAKESGFNDPKELFSVEQLEVVELGTLEDRELFWIEKFRLELGKYNVYNVGDCIIAPRRGVPLSQKEKDRLRNGLLGNKFWVGRKHSEESKKKISNHFKGKKLNQSHRQKIEDSCAKPFEIISPEGVLIVGTNLNKFCKEYNLHQGSVWEIVFGSGCSHKGWKSVKNKPKPKQITTFVDPGGNLHITNSISALARKIKISVTTLRRIKIKQLKEYKGWKLYEENN
jgi:group I intron endonuclease